MQTERPLSDPPRRLDPTTWTKILIACAVLGAVIGCRSANEKIVPDRLLGVWKTSHPNYADTSFEIRNDAIIFTQGKENLELHAVAEVSETREKGSILYTIIHINHSGQRLTFAFYYDPANHGTIRFKNQKDIVWRKEAQ